jgi:hypothetical protein
MTKTAKAAIFVLLLAASYVASAQQPSNATPAQSSAPRTVSPLFTFETDELWLNLHHFLWALGRAEAGIRDNARQSAVTAAGEAERALPSLSAEDRAAWAEAVRAYAAGLSRKAALEEPMPSTTRALATARDRPTLAGVGLDDALVATLERAAPIYRKVWWPAHLEANRAWRSAAQALVDRHGAEVVDYVTRAYGAAWPASGYAVHVSGYANAGSAYSSGITGMIVTPSQSEFTAGLYALEAIVHEAMHQWDGQTYSAMRDAAPNARIPRDLTHALIFYTSGEAVRRVEPAHVPMADKFEIWPLRLSGATLPADRLKPLLVEIWQPWLDGRGTRDQALAALVARASAVSQQ